MQFGDLKSSVLLVSSGSYGNKKESIYQDNSVYINYGLLGLATILKEKGYDAYMVQGEDESPENLIDKIADFVKSSDMPVLLSLPSVFHISWAEDFVKLFGDKFKNNIIIGGRWVVDNNIEWLREKFPENVHFTRGCPDDYITDIINMKLDNGVYKYSKVFDKLDYSVLNGFDKYQPSLEISRGCRWQCSFCVEFGNLVIKNKTPENVIGEALEICKAYNDNKLNFYFESSCFNPNENWVEEFCDEYRRNNCEFKWRCTTRVDTFDANFIERLSLCGLKVIDFGLESASPTQLMRMKKTGNPKEYLNAADSLLRECYRNNVWAKFNILLYMGESFETFGETLDYLNSRREYIKGLSVNRYTIYKNGDMNNFLSSIEAKYGIKVNRQELESQGYTNPVLSSDFNSDEIIESTIKNLATSFMSHQDFNDLKDICLNQREPDREMKKL